MGRRGEGRVDRISNIWSNIKLLASSDYTPLELLVLFSFFSRDDLRRIHQLTEGRVTRDAPKMI